MENKKVSQIIGSVLVLLGAHNAVSGTMGDLNLYQYVGVLSLGPVWESAGENQTFYLTPTIQKSYIANKSSDALVDGELFLGVQRNLTDIYQAQLGLAVAATSSAKLSGVIWDDALPQFNNYTYNYHIQHTHLALKGKLLADMNQYVMPWISASIGVGFNRAYSYTNTPVIFEAVTNPDFSSNTETSFTYTVGAGVQKALDQNWQVGVGYEFADWGQSQLGRASGQTLGTGLNLNHLYTNGLMFNVTYIA